jgi:hypothetical protein
MFGDTPDLRPLRPEPLHDVCHGPAGFRSRWFRSGVLPHTQQGAVGVAM